MVIPWEVYKVCLLVPNTKIMGSTSLQCSVLNVSHPLHSFLLGNILGDGYITKRGGLQIDHKDYAYTKWKFDYLLQLDMGVVNSSTKISEVRRIHPKTKKESISYRFYTKSLFKEWRHTFYLEAMLQDKHATKQVPLNIEKLLVDPLSIAIWFMDDGGKGGHTPHGVIFSVSNFSDVEIARLQSVLLNTFDIRSTFHAPKSSRQLYIPKSEYIKWKNVVSPFIIPCQRYKLL